MFGFRRKRKPSLLRRLVYWFLLLSGGSAGIGGAYFKDHPVVRDFLASISNQGTPQNLSQLENDVAETVEKTITQVDEFAQPGEFEVTISSVALDPSLFKPGHTLDIQAKVVRLESDGRDETVFETKAYGERLATAGRDELATGWPYRPFHVAWKPGQSLVVEVYDRMTGLFMPPTRFVLTPESSAPREFPLKSGTFTLEPARRLNRGTDGSKSKIVVASKRLGDLPGAEGETGESTRNARTNSDDVIIR